MINVIELLNKLPGSWDELKLRQYQQLTEVEITEEDEFDNLLVGVDNTLKNISVLTGVPVEQLEELPLKDMTTLAGKMAFMTTTPIPGKKSTIKWKTTEEVSLNDYITFVNMSKEPFKNLHIIIRTMAYKEKVYTNGKWDFVPFTEDEILDLGMGDCHTGFFLLRKTVRKSLTRTIRYMALKLMKQSLKALVRILVQPFRKKTKK